jgi:hypothetical protein
MYRRAGIAADRRALYIERIRQMLLPLAEADIIAIGQYIKSGPTEPAGHVSDEADLPL